MRGAPGALIPTALAVAALLATGSAEARAPAVERALLAPPAVIAATSDQSTAPEAATPIADAGNGRTSGRTKGDPLEGFNRAMFGAQQTFDRAIFRPVARGYATIIPKFIRTGLRHLLRHIREPIVFLNDVLQLKPKRAARTLARFAINTTAGVGGLFDVAKTAKLPHRPNGLGNTLARYGVGPGPYLFFPFVGPTQLRDIFGGAVDGLIYPVAIGRPFNRTDYQVATAAIGGLDLRAESDAGFKALLDGAADPYATLRSVYQQNRAAEIAEMNGTPVAPGGLDDPLIDPEADPAAPPAEGPGRQAPEDAPGSTAPPPEPAADPAVPASSDVVVGNAWTHATLGETKLVSFF
ncbi:VacJ family lipoprotein [Sphingomonas sp.]|uniref:MlaA family lipoprotein n=1 Tax=Sphingomonas sp. TaxID=28214 RepID=UPI0035A831EA